MRALPFKLSKLAAGIGSVLWWMAYAPQLQAQPLQITVPIPLASTWPAYGRVAAGQRVAAWRAKHPEIAEAYKAGRAIRQRDGHHAHPCDCDECIETQREAAEESGRLFDAQVAACKAAGCANGPDGPGPHYCAAPSEAGSDDVFALNLPHGRASYIEGPDAWPERPHPAGRPAKPKRVRVRAKPLTVADIAAGAWYVPKRGNDKTPNLFVAAIDDAGVLYDRRRPDALSVGEVTRVSMADFLALVARRADA